MSMLEKLINGKTNFYRSLPFWSWNDRLEEKELLRQIEWMNENKIGGFFMHARSGLKTEYLSDEWMRAIKACAAKAKELGMEAWVYDENGWPSGFVGGKLLEKEENHDRYLDYKIGEYDETAMVSYRITDEELVRSDGSEAGEYLNVYEHLSSATADILNPDVVEQFLQLTHEQYLACFGDRFSKEICGFFTDEPQYYRWQTPYTVMIREYFEKELHEDILDGIGLLFLKKKGYRRFRYRYWSGMQRLMLASFAKMVYDWCDTHHVRLTGHYIEESGLGAQMMCCGGIMPFYEYEHIPGIDWLSRTCWSAFPVRQVASVAAQLGRKQVLGEIYAGCGWDVTPRELKTMTDYLYLNGLNRTCQHLLPYSERGNRIHDYPAHYSDINPWVKEYFGDFNEHFNVLGMLIGESEELVHTAVLHPIRSAYFDYDDALQKRGFGVKALDDALLDLTDQLEESAIAYHFLDETLLAKYGDVSGAAIRCGHCTYDALIVPYCLTMDSSTERLLRQYVENGGRILLYRDRPQFLESEPFDYSYLSSNLTWEELLAERPVQVSATGGQLCVTIRKKDDQIFCLALNRSHTEKCCVHLDFHQNERSLKRVFWPDGKEEILTFDFCLNEGESALLLPCDEPAPVAKNRETVICDGTYRVISSDENALTVDKVQISFNGSDYDQPLGIPMAFRRLLKSRYQGKLYLKYGFNVEVVPQTLRFEMYLAETDQVIFNDLPLEKGNRDLAALVRPGRNELVVVCDYQQNDNVYRVLFDPDVTEGLKNCLVYDYELEPLILRGAFGVYSKTGFQRGNCPRVWTADEFVIGELPKSLTGLVQGGYPFFAGKICLETTISCTTDHVCLFIPGRWHAAVIRVGDVDCGTLLFGQEIDCSAAMKPGDNLVRLELTIGNRNLYGPHHFSPEEEPMMQGVESFEFGDDNLGVEYDYRESMAFVEPLGKD